jgi:hypothetical protein
MTRSKNWDEDDKVDPIKGGNRPTDFLRANFKILGTGGTFRTVKAKFPAKTIQAAAEKAGWKVRIEDQNPWLKVTITGRLLRKPAASKTPGFHKDAGKVYPSGPEIDIFS